VYYSIINFTNVKALSFQSILSYVVLKDIQNRYVEHQRKKKESILAFKDKVCIVIYGAYNPPADEKHLGEKERLIKLCDRLRKEGYINTFIVEDFPDNKESNIPNLEKSLDCLGMADLNILVFTCRGKTGSVARELIHAICNPTILYKCRVFEEVDKGISAMETLLKEELSSHRYKVTQIERGDDEDLYEHASSDVFLFLREYSQRFI
jgi:predicted GIY-YIG superfamily endonuclease